MGKAQSFGFCTLFNLLTDTGDRSLERLSDDGERRQTESVQERWRGGRDRVAVSHGSMKERALELDLEGRLVFLMEGIQEGGEKMPQSRLHSQVRGPA